MIIRLQATSTNFIIKTFSSEFGNEWSTKLSKIVRCELRQVKRTIEDYIGVNIQLWTSN